MPTVTFDEMLKSFGAFTEYGGPLWLLVSAVCWLAASLFAFHALMQLKAHADDGRVSMRGAFFSFLAASLMAGSPTFLQTIAGTAFGASAWDSPLATMHDNVGGDGTFKVVLTIVSFIGYCFFVRGIWILKEAGEPQRNHSTVGKAIAVLAAGMAAIYIEFTLKMLANSFGWDISRYIK